MTHIRHATESDASRIAEIIVTNYRVNFYPFFRNDTFYFGELNVLDTAKEYSAGSAALKNTFVYDDGVIKGIIRISGNEVEKLYVEPLFQNQDVYKRQEMFRYGLPKLLIILTKRSFFFELKKVY